MKSNDETKGLSRRDMLGRTTVIAAASLTGVAGGLGVARLNGGADAAAQTAPRAGDASPHGRTEVAPGELDEYYVFSSSGQSGEVRILGLPSMRELMRVPVFNRCSATGWGQTNESLKVLTEGLTPEAREFLKTRGGTFMNGDLHHPHPSFTDGTYDGRYLFANDKANTRVCRIRLDIMKCDKIIQLPNQSTVHGLRVQKYPRTGYVFCNGEDRVPVPNDGKILDDPKQYMSLFTAVDGDTIKADWQIRVNGNRDNVVRESADLLYNLVVLWVELGINPKHVWAEMNRREELFGIAEKRVKELDAKARRKVASLAAHRLQKQR
jgi:nitrous-oxide reductase